MSQTPERRSAAGRPAPKPAASRGRAVTRVLAVVALVVVCGVPVGARLAQQQPGQTSTSWASTGWARAF